MGWDEVQLDGMQWVGWNAMGLGFGFRLSKGQGLGFGFRLSKSQGYGYGQVKVRVSNDYRQDSGQGWDGIGWDEMQWDGMQWDGCDAIGWDGRVCQSQDDSQD